MARLPPAAWAVALAALLAVPPAAPRSVAGAVPGATALDAEVLAGTPVVLPGSLFPAIAPVPGYVPTPPNPGLRGPLPPPAPSGGSDGGQEWLPVPVLPGQAAGVPVDRIGVYRWTGDGFARVVAQVDERFERYLANPGSGFAGYSQADLELTYAFDQEGTRRACDGGPARLAFCPGPRATPDPVPGFDADDEVVFRLGDAGGRAPAGEGVPGVTHLAEVALRVADGTGGERWAYVGVADRPLPALPALVGYARDADADDAILANHAGFGGAAGGACYPGDGVDAPKGEPTLCRGADGRRPKDSATVATATYQFHYAGRWTLDGLRLRQPGGAWGPSLVDRWKGRAFQQRTGTAAAGLVAPETEVEWTRSSVTLGERAGPVRVLRETWGADSGTDTTRLDTFYPDRIEQLYRVRVHPMPADGLYAYWDHAQGAVDTYYSPAAPGGVAVDGRRDNAVTCRPQTLSGGAVPPAADCPGDNPLLGFDAPDPTVEQGAVPQVAWDEVAGPAGSLVTVSQVLSAPPGPVTTYYRDDAGFDDGTGHDPRPRQGAFGSHGLHIELAGDTDNLFLPVPSDELVLRVGLLPFAARLPNVGVAVLRDAAAPVAEATCRTGCA